MAPHSSTLAWKIPWVEEPGRLQSMGSRRVRHDWVTSLPLFTFMHWGRKWQPTPVFLPGESQGWGALWAGVYGVAQSRTRLKWLSSSSSSSMHFSLKLSQTFPFRNPIRQSTLFLFVFNILLSSYTSILFKSLKKCLTFPDLNTITTFFLLFINRIAVWALQ